MEATKDGFVHQSRQDELFARFEMFADSTMKVLRATIQARDLTTVEIEIMQSLQPLLEEMVGPFVPRSKRDMQQGHAS